MKLELVKHTFTPNSTIGSLSIDGVFECYILGNPRKLNPALGLAHIDIPYGVFAIQLRSTRDWRRDPEKGTLSRVTDPSLANAIIMGLVDVPGRTDIEIHPGNTSKDTKGCQCPGSNRTTDFVGGSVMAEAALFVKVKAAFERGEAVTIDVHPIQADPLPQKGEQAG